jgi:hypothetical protein
MHSPEECFGSLLIILKMKFWHFKAFKTLSGKFFKVSLFLILRMIDFEASKKVDFFIANSKVSQMRIKKYYGEGFSHNNTPLLTIKNLKKLNRKMEIIFW